MRLTSHRGRYVVVAAVVLAALVLLLQSYDSLKKVFLSKMPQGKLAQSDTSCLTLAAASLQKENPNKALFISCGGLFE
jgi:hypothetical protein